jgi:N-alpha-acetyltransferase 15/16, NatA auxiliary subunit
MLLGVFCCSRGVVDSLSVPLPPTVKEVIDSCFDLLPTSTSLSAHNDDFLLKHSQSPAHVQSGLRIRQLLEPSTHSKNEQDLVGSLGLKMATLDNAREGLELLTEWKSEQQVKEKYREAARQRWPDATLFAKE